MNPFIIGGDGGGTGCRVAIADRLGRVLAQAVGGPANATSDFAQTVASLRAALGAAAGQLGLTLADLRGCVVHFGLAGVMSPQEGARVAAEFPFDCIHVAEDRTVAVIGALGDAEGVLMAIGTGTILAAQRGGQLQRLGGWGLQISDQASGAWLGRALLEQVILCHDGLAAFTDLTNRTYAEFEGDPLRLVSFAATARPADYARFAPAIVAAARENDATGRDLMQRGAAYLTHALNALGLSDGDRLCLSGGLGPHYAPYLPPKAQAAIVPAQGTGLDGALRLAMAAATGRETAGLGA